MSVFSAWPCAGGAGHSSGVDAKEITTVPGFCYPAQASVLLNAAPPRSEILAAAQAAACGFLHYPHYLWSVLLYSCDKGHPENSG